MEKVKPEQWNCKFKDNMSEYKDGSVIWYIPNDDYGPINDDNFTKFDWHCLDGPAYYCKRDGEFEYWVYNQLHRYDGPALRRFTGKYKDEEWWIWDTEIDGDMYQTWLEEMGMDIKNLTPEDKVLIDLRWKT